MRALGLAAMLGCVSGCALSHTIENDAALDVGGISRVLLPCTGGEPAGTMRDCGWNVGGGVACRPGTLVQLGCADGCGVGSCSGDTMIRICDTAPCTAAQSLAFDDDSSCGGLCSYVDGVTCPDSGELFVLTASFTFGAPYHCAFERR